VKNVKSSKPPKHALKKLDGHSNNNNGCHIDQEKTQVEDKTIVDTTFPNLDVLNVKGGLDMIGNPDTMMYMRMKAIGLDLALELMVRAGEA